MTDQAIPKKKILKRRVQVAVECDETTAFDFIGSGPKLPSWLKKSGKIPGCTGVEVLEGPYDHIGARRKVSFEDDSTAIEELLTYNNPANYSYRINEFSGSIKKLTDAAYGQCWFDTIDGETRISWDYTFTYKNLFGRAILSLILTFSYKKFMRKSLENAKAILEKES